MTEYEFNVLIETPYPEQPWAPHRKSNYIDLPNTTWDPTLGQHALEDQLHSAISAERLGFDGVTFNEQHNGPIGQLGNPLVALGYIAARTERIRLGSVGPIINDYLSPIRLAEELAALDIISRGRLFFGLPMGHGMQYHSTGVMNPARARRRFREANDLLIAAMTQPGPFEWKGEFFNIPYVNLWPRPLQTPHPPVWLPGGGSVETLALAAKHRYVYQAALSPRAGLLRTIATLKELCEKEGYEMPASQLALVITVHVAETDEQARREVEPHELWSYQNFFRSPAHDNFPPGYISETSLRRAMAGGYRSTPLSELTYDDIVDNGWIIAGSPQTVADQLQAFLDETGAGRLVLSFTTGTKPRWLVDKSMTLFAEEVIPKLRAGGRPPTADQQTVGYSTASEYGARRPKDVAGPRARFGDAPGLVDPRVSHLAELREAIVEPLDS